MNFQRSRLFVELAQISLIDCLSTFTKESFTETTRPVSLKFHMQPPGKGLKKVYIIGSRSHDQDGHHAHI